MTGRAAPRANVAFTGFGPDALSFLRELRENNDKAWFDANRERYQRELRAPMEALVREMEGFFGPGKLFRPHRDVRFSKDKRPYKEWIAAIVGGQGREAARYVQLSPDELLLAAGAHQLDREQLVRFRRAVDVRSSGEALAAILAELSEKGYEIGGKTLQRGPRGVDPNHPRIELLKHTGVTMVLRRAAGPWLQDPGEVTALAMGVFGDAEPLIAWARAQLG